MSAVESRDFPFSKLLVVVIAVSLGGAVTNSLALSLCNERSRLRETPVYFAMRHLADYAGVNMLAASPVAVHREFDLRSAGPMLDFAAKEALVNLFLLGGVAVVFVLATIILWVILRGGEARRERLLLWAPSVLAALLLSPFLAAAAHGLIQLPGFSVPFEAERRVVFAIAAAFELLALGGLLRVNRDGERLGRVAAITGLIFALPVGIGLAIRPEGPSRRPPAPAGAPNILLISIDTLRADHLHCYGYPRVTSPVLDQLSSEGALFSEAISPTSWTLPSHLTLLTSLPPERHGVKFDGRRLGPDILTMAEVLRDRGYDTGGFVSGAYLDGRFGFAKGFDEYDDYSLVRLSGASASRQVSSPIVARLGTGYLERWAGRRDHRPFFLFLHFFDVHDPYVPPPPFDRKFTAGLSGIADRGERDRQRMIGLYDGEIAWTDHHVGVVLETLRRMGILDQTIVVVTADHGEEFYEHGHDGHRKTLFDEVIHVPLLMRYPKRIPRGLEIGNQVRLMDVMPTVLSLAGLTGRPAPPSSEVAGDLSPLFNAGTTAHFPELLAFGQLDDRLSSARTNAHKYIQDHTAGREELYELGDDPQELVNRSGSVPERSLRAALSRWKAYCGRDASTAERYALDEEQKRSLKALGYIH